MKIFSLSLAVCLLLGGGIRLKASSILTNGGFETGNLNGWTASGDVCCTFVSSSFRGFTPHTGNDFVVIGPFGIGYLDQLATTIDGDSYTLSYVMGNIASPNLFETTVGGNTVFNQSNVPDQNWTSYSFTFIAVGTSTDVQFKFTNPINMFALDDVSLVDNGPATPEPGTAAPAIFGVCLMLTLRQKNQA